MRKLILLCIAFLMQGCYGSDHVLLLDKPLPPTPDNQAIEFINGAPSQPYIEVAILDAKRGSLVDCSYPFRNYVGSRVAELWTRDQLWSIPGHVVKRGSV